jgi:hypothetical protein
LIPAPTTIAFCVVIQDRNMPTKYTKKAKIKRSAACPLLCRVERLCQSGSDRDISYYLSIKNQRFLDCARNDKTALTRDESVS